MEHGSFRIYETSSHKSNEGNSHCNNITKEILNTVDETHSISVTERLEEKQAAFKRDRQTKHKYKYT